jgi:hypothetical protein
MRKQFKAKAKYVTAAIHKRGTEEGAEIPDRPYNLGQFTTSGKSIAVIEILDCTFLPGEGTQC